MGEHFFSLGCPGAGKTTIGRTPAKRLNMTFADSDNELMARTGVSIATIFEIEGEAGFRVRESVTLAELVQRDGLVLATEAARCSRQKTAAACSACRAGSNGHLSVIPQEIAFGQLLLRPEHLVQVGDGQTIAIRQHDDAVAAAGLEGIQLLDQISCVARGVRLQPDFRATLLRRCAAQGFSNTSRPPAPSQPRDAFISAHRLELSSGPR